MQYKFNILESCKKVKLLLLILNGVEMCEISYFQVIIFLIVLIQFIIVCFYKMQTDIVALNEY